jgi:nitrile hydratase subunit beta
MNGVHDMGGMHGFGSIEIEENEPLFHAEWERRVRGMADLMPFNLDEFRYGIERMAPADYLRASYFERWLASAEYGWALHGFLTEDEIDERAEFFRLNPDAPMPKWPGANPDLPDEEEACVTAISEIKPRFAVGDEVVVTNAHPTGHTRRPRYVRGKRGTILIVHGPEVLPDTNAHGLGENPEVVYNVRFDGRELWGESAEPNQQLSIDLWEGYLEPAPPRT